MIRSFVLSLSSPSLYQLSYRKKYSLKSCCRPWTSIGRLACLNTCHRQSLFGDLLISRLSWINGYNTHSLTIFRNFPHLWGWLSFLVYPNCRRESCAGVTAVPWLFSTSWEATIKHQQTCQKDGQLMRVLSNIGCEENCHLLSAIGTSLSRITSCILAMFTNCPNSNMDESTLEEASSYCTIARTNCYLVT